ncbi:glycosyltransferase family 4 protein [Phyllobacterium sp. 0TCS1.6C]|jgi:glycosyltransferase involved in cell wall biosynthesis|uniref:glycosyltransferase family 4 protein n=1 Tax=unclassified Phyllobacterium TaxID=2638441 RepID=UPI002264890D|nr:MULTISPECIES: glycosyltransferase family 4 protein [unclassified Phyllobacterium]MCX8282155.1 glycosyltransferase family 4 protein [Phyllobacterium sp. 0TCS1.6C]MCX8296363.1 glycosyltransferase family 4 protein [Phyllobacterium sp. 0TCS1.6A]
MHVAFVHRRGFGQFSALAEHLASSGHNVSLICETVDRRLPAVRVIKHRAESGPRSDTQMARHLGIPDHHIRIGHRVAETFEAMIRQGEQPDLVIGHIGWGSMIFTKDVMPKVPAIGYCEFFYRAEGADVGFAPDDRPDAETRKRLRLRNISQLLSFESIDGGISPTQWQKSLYPAAVQNRIAVCHEGVDQDRFKPDKNASLRLPDGRVLKAGDPPIITFVARDLEPYRGFPQALEAAARVVAQNPDVLFIFVGGDGVSYGKPPPGGGSWKDKLLAEYNLPQDRVLFTGPISHDLLRQLYQISTAHIYLTYPFVLSWSVVEAMACGALIVGSDTPPVREVIKSEKNGLLVPFFDTAALTETLLRILRKPDDFIPLRAAARRTVEHRFKLSDCLARQKALIGSVLRGG